VHFDGGLSKLRVAQACEAELCGVTMTAAKPEDCAPAKFVRSLKRTWRHASIGAHATWIASALLCAMCTPSRVKSQLRAEEANENKASAAPAYPASMVALRIPSNGALLNAFVYVAAGAGPHPAVVLMHGFPGNERNLDLAQDIRFAGWDVLYFDYRGSWGSPGDFSFSHAIEDGTATVADLHDAATAKALRLDSAHVVLIGHSMGGFVAVQCAAADPAVLAIGLISATDLGGRIPEPLPKAGEEAAIRGLSAGYAAEGMAPLAGCTAEGLARETLANAVSWSFLGKVEALKNRPALLVTSDDGFAPANSAFAAALRQAGNERVAALHLPTDHSYSDQRSALSAAVVHWLARLRPASR
jgi:uncharacterized protein